MQLNRRQLSVITKAAPPPKQDPMVALMAEIASLKALLAVPPPAPPAPTAGYDDRALVARLESVERAVTAMAAARFTFQIIRDPMGRIKEIEVTRPGQAPSSVWKK